MSFFSKRKQSRMIPSLIPQKLPKVVTQVANDLPEYLRDTEQFTRAAEQAIQVACDELVASNLDWGTYNELARVKSIDQIDYCKSTPIACGPSQIYILGIAHSSLTSADQVKQAIKELSPSVVALESDVERTFGRNALQVPLLESFIFDWDRLGNLAELGGDGPTLAQLARAGLLEGKLNAEAAQFLAMLGSFTGAPEITCIGECNKQGISLASIDILEKLKRAQNASLAAIPGSSRRIGDLPESVLRFVTGDQGILRAYFRVLYGSQQLKEVGADAILPTTLYRLCELRQRSRPCDDFLLREIHRIFRPSEFFSRIFLRDVFMACRIRALAKAGGKILVVCGAAHAQGIRSLVGDFKIPDEVLTVASAAALLTDGHLLNAAWTQFFGSLEPRLPRSIPGAELALMTLLRRVVGERVGKWAGKGWLIEQVPREVSERVTCDESWTEKAKKYEELWKGLLSGDIDAYPN